MMDMDSMEMDMDTVPRVAFAGAAATLVLLGAGSGEDQPLGPEEDPVEEGADILFDNNGLYNIDGNGAYPEPNTGLHAITGLP